MSRLKRITFLWLAISTLFQIAHTSPSQLLPRYDYGVERKHVVKRQSGTYPVTGAQTGVGPDGSVPLRQEIRQLEQDQTTWTLYILGLDMLQWTNQTDMLSWYQIAGIHGRPYLTYDGVQATPGNENTGYCQHVSILFPTWHRPYLALYEQVLYGIVQQIAQQWPEGSVRDQYAAAALNFRIPYWDWAAVPADGTSVLPDSVGGSASVTVDGPAGTQTIANPLFSFQFHPLDTTQLPDAPFNQYAQTMRYPTTMNASAVSQNNLVAQQLDSSAASFRSRLYNLFTNYHDYTTFSNEAWIPSDNPNGYDSIESIHDQIHGITGNNGHMTYIDYSAFDPIFFLHHAMIDRCFAMWQVLNPNSYVVPEPATYASRTTAQGATQNVTSHLTPFHTDANGDFWTSENVQSTETFGYAYAETANKTGVNVTGEVVAAINSLYSSTASVNSSATKFKRALVERGILFNSALTSRDSSDAVTEEWVVNIRVKKNALGAPFYIYIFLGDVNPDQSTWAFDPDLVGSHYVFTKSWSALQNCADCNSDQLVTGTVPLTSALVNDISAGKLASLNPTDVKPYLATNFQYRVAMLDGTVVGQGDVPSLMIAIVSAPVSQSGDALPTWGEMTQHIDISTG